MKKAGKTPAFPYVMRYYCSRIQNTSEQASVSEMATALGESATPETLFFQWLEQGLEPSEQRSENQQTILAAVHLGCQPSRGDRFVGAGAVGPLPLTRQVKTAGTGGDFFIFSVVRRIGGWRPNAGGEENAGKSEFDGAEGSRNFSGCKGCRNRTRKCTPLY